MPSFKCLSRLGEHEQLLVVNLECSENSGCHGRPKAEGLRGERESTFGLAILCLVHFPEGHVGTGHQRSSFQPGPASCGTCLK